MRMETFNVLLASASIVALAAVVLIFRMNRYLDQQGNSGITVQEPRDEKYPTGG